MRRTLTHLDERGTTRMVDVSAKPVQARRATATATLHCRAATIRQLRQAALPKGDALAVAKVAAIQAVKRTADLIPLCHPLPIEHVNLAFTTRPNHIAIRCTVTTTARTGVEMEALTGATVAALTLYDMCKAVDHTMVIDSIQVLEKVKQESRPDHP
jgi:cyclic pyranopterin phosphate synthase